MSRMKFSSRALSVVAGLCLVVAASPAGAQWPKRIASGIPLTADGKPNLEAPTPKAVDGLPDLSGVWTIETPRPQQPQPPPVAAEGTGAIPPLSRNVFGNIRNPSAPTSATGWSPISS
jgi:hypothetical protein